MDVESMLETLWSFRIKSFEEVDPNFILLTDVLLSQMTVSEKLSILDNFEATFNPTKVISDLISSLENDTHSTRIKELQSAILAIASCPPSACSSEFIL